MSRCAHWCCHCCVIGQVVIPALATLSGITSHRSPVVGTLAAVPVVINALKAHKGTRSIVKYGAGILASLAVGSVCGGGVSSCTLVWVWLCPHPLYFVSGAPCAHPAHHRTLVRSLGNDKVHALRQSLWARCSPGMFSCLPATIRLACPLSPPPLACLWHHGPH